MTGPYTTDKIIATSVGTPVIGPLLLIALGEIGVGLWWVCALPVILWILLSFFD